jgi:hypothetical protein
VSPSSLAKTLAHKEGSTVAKVLHQDGQPITFRKPNGRVVCFDNDPVMQGETSDDKGGRGCGSELEPASDADATWG